MTERQIPDRSAEPALQESLDRGPQSRTAAHSEDVARDAGKGPQPGKSGAPTDVQRSLDPDNRGESTMTAKDEAGDEPRDEPGDEPSDEPSDEQIERMTGVPSSSRELSQM